MGATPRDDGCRWPAEWERHRATWLVWPHNPDTWPGQLDAVESVFVEIVASLRTEETLRLVVADAAAEEAVRSRLAAGGAEAGVQFLQLATDDSWVRDTGPVFLERADGGLAAVDFGFDAWGGKYPPWDRDAALARAVAEAAGARRYTADFVLEGGSVDGNGAGTVITTRSCLLNPNRETGRTQERMEERLQRWLCAERVVWLEDGIEGDDTDGHVDDLARFVDAGTVVAVREPDASEPNHAILEENWRRLCRAEDARGRRLSLVPLPMPPPLVVKGLRCPASYANFYLANRRALVPVFGAVSDARALRTLEELLPGREIVPVSARALVAGLGALHCLTQQEPEPRIEMQEPPEVPSVQRLPRGH